MSRNIMVTKALPTEDEINMKDTVQAGKLIFTEFHNMLCGFLINNNRLTAMQCFPLQNSFGIGAIYIGRVRDITPNIHAIFVEIQKGVVCYLPESAVKENTILTNREYDGRIISGDEILVQIIKEQQKGKRIQVTTDIQFHDKTPEEAAVLLQNAKHKTCYSCIQKADFAWKNMFECVKPEEYNEIITDRVSLFQELQSLIPESDENSPKIRLYEDKTFSLSKLYSLDTKYDTAVNKRIWLKSGAFLIIEHTEAMTVIDVNSGKYEVKKQDEDYYYDVNCEAASEIALQLRLRSISGIIIIDFINMRGSKRQHELLTYMRDLVEQDICKCVAVDMTPLGLMELTRQKKFKPLYEQVKD